MEPHEKSYPMNYIPSQSLADHRFKEIEREYSELMSLDFPELKRIFKDVKAPTNVTNVGMDPSFIEKQPARARNLLYLYNIIYELKVDMTPYKKVAGELLRARLDEEVKTMVQEARKAQES